MGWIGEVLYVVADVGVVWEEVCRDVWRQVGS